MDVHQTSTLRYRNVLVVLSLVALFLGNAGVALAGTKVLINGDAKYTCGSGTSVFVDGFELEVAPVAGVTPAYPTPHFENDCGVAPPANPAGLGNCHPFSTAKPSANGNVITWSDSTAREILRNTNYHFGFQYEPTVNLGASVANKFEHTLVGRYIDQGSGSDCVRINKAISAIVQGDEWSDGEVSTLVTPEAPSRLVLRAPVVHAESEGTITVAITDEIHDVMSISIWAAQKAITLTDLDVDNTVLFDIENPDVTRLVDSQPLGSGEVFQTPLRNAERWQWVILDVRTVDVIDSSNGDSDGDSEVESAFFYAQEKPKARLTSMPTPGLDPQSDVTPTDTPQVEPTATPGPDPTPPPSSWWQRLARLVTDPVALVALIIIIVAAWLIRRDHGSDD